MHHDALPIWLDKGARSQADEGGHLTRLPNARFTTSLMLPVSFAEDARINLPRRFAILVPQLALRASGPVRAR
ncbi:hypothetical protein [Paracoccus beibuensis]|uniref:hypothetical protein n=1 Tax=Paracoccus beibuensis TaxID=547602 RepID=UPI0022406E53|nr:hypothetical protein [Paracoccus beibuensis]